MPAPQVVVALLESLQEGGPVSAAAIRVLEELVLICRRTHRDKLRTIPPLPNWLPELEKLNEVGACAHTHAEVGDRQAWQEGRKTACKAAGRSAAPLAGIREVAFNAVAPAEQAVGSVCLCSCVL